MPSWITHLITANKIAEKLKIEEDKREAQGLRFIIDRYFKWF